MSPSPRRPGSQSRPLLALALVLGVVLVAVLVAVRDGDGTGVGAGRGDEARPPGIRPPSDLRGGEITADATSKPGGEASLVAGDEGTARRAVQERETIDAAAARFADAIDWGGQVLDAESEEPIAEVELVLAGGPYASRATTDEQGSFSVRWSAGLGATLSLAHPAYVDLQAPEVEFEEPGRFLLRPSARIEGKIRRYVPHEQARVRAWRQTASSLRFWEALEGEIGADGSFVLTDLAGGDYAVTALVPESFVGLEMGIHVEAGETAEVVLDASPGAALFGRVTRHDTHGTVPGVELRIEPRTDGLPHAIRLARTAQAVTANDGTYEITGLAPGIHRLRATTPWGASRSDEIHIPASGDRQEHDLAFAGPSRLSGFVVDGEGKGARGATVLAFSRADPRWAMAILERGVDQRTPRTTTAGGGFFTLDGLPAGTSLLVVAFPPGTALPGEETAERPRGLPGFRTVKGIQPGEELRDVEVHLPASYTVAGRVSDLEGRPLPGASVQAEATYKKRPVRTLRTFTDEEGRFLLHPLRGGDVVIRAAHADHLSASQSLRVQGEETPELEFLLAPCLSISGVALDEHGFGVPHIPIGLRLDPEHTVPPEHEGRPTRRTVATDSFGRFRLDDLFDGPWRVVGGSFEWEMTGADPPVVVPSLDSFTTVTFAPRDRPERFSIAGRVGLTDGGVPTGVRIHGLQGGVLEVDRGEFLATGLTPTRHRLRVFADGHVPRSIGPIDPVPGKTVDVGLIDLLPATRLTVRVTNSKGKAVDGARVVLVPLPLHEGGMGDEAARITLSAEGKGRYRADFVPRFAWRLVTHHKSAGRDARTVRVEDRDQQSIRVKLK